MPRYEYNDGVSASFWKIELSETSYTTTHGRVGTDGRSATRTFASEAEARKAYDEQIASKLKKGYVEVGGDRFSARRVATPGRVVGGRSSVPEPEPEAMPAAGQPGGLRFEMTQGDPVPGTIQRALDDQERHRPRSGRNWAMRAWERCCAAISWEGGFIAKARLGRQAERGEHTVEEMLADLCTHPSGRLLRELEIGPLGIYDIYDYSGVVDTLLQHPPPALRSLLLADFDCEDCEISWSELGELGRLWWALPDLEEVVVRGGTFALGRIDLPRARSFAVRTGGLSRQCIESICKARWPELQRLEIWFGNACYGAEGEVQDIEPIMQGQGLSKLTSLGLMNAEFTDRICRVLARSPIAKQLTELDLSMGTMTDEGAVALTRDRHAFPRLERLLVADNYLTGESMGRLREITGDLRWGDQHDPGAGDLDRYVSVGE